MPPKPPKTILFLARGGTLHGSQRQLLYLLDALDRSEFVPLVVYDRKGAFADALAQRDIESLFLPLRLGGRPWRWLTRNRHIRTLIQLATDRRAALVHSSYLWMGHYMKAIALATSIPSILHVRKPLSSRQVKKYRCRNADHLICISKRSHTNLLDAGIAANRLCLICDGVDLDIYHPLAQKHPPAELTIGMAGRISRRKFQLECLQAAAILAGQGVPVQVFLAGEAREPEYKDQLDAFARDNGLDNRVTLLGHIDSMSEFLNGLDVLVSLSGGSVMYEAMACGTAVLSAGFTPASGAMHLRDNDTGVRLNSHDPHNIAAALKTLWDDPDRRATLAQNGLTEARAHLGRDTMANQTIQLYRSLLQ